MKKIYGCFFLLLLSAAVGCKKNDIAEPIIISEVEKEFFVEMQERLGPSPRSLQMNLRTIKVQDCLDAGIQYDLSITPALIQLDLADIVLPPNCDPGAAPARETALIGFVPIGNQNFDINLRNTVNNKGTLTVTADAYTLRMATEEGLVIPTKQLRRIPDFTIWGYITYNSATGVEIAQNFYQELALLSAPSTFAIGHYGYFAVPGGAAQPIIADSPPAAALRSFVFRFIRNPDDLRNLVQRYRTDYSQHIQIKLLNDTGESF
ncbi:MAG: hypothetical protein KF852_11510 [Saprospiraceae bacterium]|nr:hypothetical protein [Saprospiraceae bacterium]